MRKRAAFLGVVVVCASAAMLTALTGTTERVSVASGGTQAVGASGSGNPSISADGRFVAFESDATNLAAGAGNGVEQVYVHDRQAGTTELISVGNFGAPGNSFSFVPSISADGRFVAFSSDASNLVFRDTNNTFDVFVRDRVAGTTELVSASILGVHGNGDSHYCAISADGRFVAFASSATNLVAGDTNGNNDIFVRDRLTNTIERVNVASDGTQANGFSDRPSISASGRFVAFESFAANLAPGGTNGVAQVYIHDRQTGATERVSVGAGGAVGDADSTLDLGRQVTADGRFVAFTSFATNLTSPSSAGQQHIYVRDRAAGTTERISVTADGSEGNHFSQHADITPDGRFVGFESAADNLVPGDTNGNPDVFVRDRLAGTTERVSVASDGTQANPGNPPNLAGSHFPSLSADGQIVAFGSSASNLVANDTNGINDAFVHVAPGANQNHVTLWLGNDAHGDVFRTDTVGTMLNEIPNLPVSGIAFDGTFLYFSDPGGLLEQLTTDGSTLVQAVSIPSAGDAEDLAWDSKRQRLWRIDHFPASAPTLRKINVATGTIEASYPLPSADPVDFVSLAPLGGLGVAYDGTRDLLYVSFCQAGCARLDAGVVKSVDPNTGTVIGDLFRTAGFATGGLAYDPAADTLWVGSADVVRNMTLTGTVLSSFVRPQPGGFVDGLELVPAPAVTVPCAIRVLCTPLQPFVVQPFVSGPPYPTSALLIDFGARVGQSADIVPVDRLALSLRNVTPAVPIQLSASGGTILAQVIPPNPVIPPDPIVPVRSTFNLLVHLLKHPLSTVAPVLVPPNMIVPPNPIVPLLIPPNPITPPNPIVPATSAFDVRYDLALAGQGTSAQNLHFAIGSGQPLRFTNVVVGPPQSPEFHVTFGLERTGGTVTNAPLFTVTSGGAFASMPACAEKHADPDRLWPPNHELAAVNLFARPVAGAPLGQIHVRAVNQNEPVIGGPDAAIQQSATGDLLWLRAERAGDGDGRVYHVTFTADDGAGNECLDEVKVVVPHDASHKPGGDDGPLHDSLRR
jgi:Tol biopolymer transport system component